MSTKRPTDRGPLRVGIVGRGNIADNHYRAYRGIPGVEVIGVCDVDAARARAFADERGIAGAHGSVTELLDSSPDAISVCTPHPTHEVVVVEAAPAGVAILCEKPIAADLAAAERMIAATATAGFGSASCSSDASGPACRGRGPRSTTAGSGVRCSRTARSCRTAAPTTTRPPPGAAPGPPTAEGSS